MAHLVKSKGITITVRTEGIREATKKFRELRKELVKIHKIAKKIGLSKKQINIILTKGWEYGERTKLNPAE